MSKKKNNKKHNNFNSEESKAKFFKQSDEFHNIKSINEKYEKCFKLIDDSVKIKVLKEDDKPKYYYNLAELYYYASKKESLQYNFSNGETYNIDEIREEKNKNNLEKVIKYKKLSFENYIKCLDTIKKLDVKIGNYDRIYDRITEGIRITSQELSILYYLIEEEEKFLLYGKYAVEWNSLNSIYVFLKYYCDKKDYENAAIYYNLMHRYKSGKFNNHYKDTTLKIISYRIYFEFLYDSGMYEDLLNVLKDFKKYIINNELIENKIEYNKPINEKIDKCKSLIEKSKIIKNDENILLEYFDKEILNLMSVDNKIYVETSLNIYEYMKSTEITMDYSATLMPILKAIENIIFEIIAKKYHDFIMEKRERNYINPRDIKAFINQKDNTFIREIKQLELGSALNLIGYRLPDESALKPIGYRVHDKDKLIIRKCFMEFCNENNMKNSRDIIITLYNELDALRKKRNLVAHKNRVFEECVEECYDILLNNIKFIEFLYTNFRFVFEK